MTKKTTDLDIWNAFIKHIDKPTLSKQPPSENLSESPDWLTFTHHMDMINQHRNIYTPKALPNFIKQKKTSLSTYEPPLFLYSSTQVSILELDRLDRKQLPKLMSHNLSVVDLHGYTIPLGYERLKSAISEAIQRKSRILKVITGKGRPNPEPESPTLKSIFPKWMQEPFFTTKTIKIRKASPEHGGEGAFFVYLKHKK